MRYRIEFSKQAEKALDGLERSVQRRIAAAIDKLATKPRPAGAKQLKGEEAFRIRVGDYRVVYLIDDGQLVVLIVRLAHRREVYR